MKNISRDIEQELLHEDSIVAITVKGVTMDGLVKWSKHMAETLESWPDEQPCFLLYDLSHPGAGMPFLILTDYHMFGIGITKMGRFAVQDILRRKPQLIVYLAVVLSKAASGKIAQKYAKEHKKSVEHRIFFDRESALAWLMDVASP